MARRQRRSPETQKKPSVVKDIIELNVHTAQYSKANKCEMSSCDPLEHGTDQLNVTQDSQPRFYSWSASQYVEYSEALIKGTAPKLKATACLFQCEAAPA